jgi:hypothetical protein
VAEECNEEVGCGGGREQGRGRKEREREREREEEREVVGGEMGAGGERGVGEPEAVEQRGGGVERVLVLAAHSLDFVELTHGAGVSWFRAVPARLLSPFACSLLIYLVVYYLCRLQMSSSSSCLSPATNGYARLFPFSTAPRNLGSGGDNGWGL